jgi:hypothetical protein
LSPAERPSASRTAAGMVIWLLLEMVAVCIVLAPYGR